MKVVIVGCGGLGSILSKRLVLENNTLEEIVLIDNDIFEKENLLLKTSTLQDLSVFENHPKSLVVEYFLNQITDISIHAEIEFFNSNDLDRYEDYIKIDCRDNKKSDSKFDYKFTMDGPYALINVFPEDDIEDIQTNYTLEKSYIYSEKLASIFSFVVRNNLLTKGKYIINLLEGEIINVTNTNERIRIPVPIANA
jgi:hypothetical protein